MAPATPAGSLTPHRRGYEERYRTMTPRWMAWIGAAISLILVILCLIALAGCKGAICPPGQHAVPASGGFTCQKY